MGERTTHNMNVCTDLKSKLMEILQDANVILSISSEGSSLSEIMLQIVVPSLKLMISDS